MFGFGHVKGSSDEEVNCATPKRQYSGSGRREKNGWPFFTGKSDTQQTKDATLREPTLPSSCDPTYAGSLGPLANGCSDTESPDAAPPPTATAAASDSVQSGKSQSIRAPRRYSCFQHLPRKRNYQRSRTERPIKRLNAAEHPYRIRTFM